MSNKLSKCRVCGKEFARMSPRQARCSGCMDIRCACGKSIEVKLARLEAKRERMCWECRMKGSPIGARFFDHGYVQIKTKDGWQYEHRVVMEEMLGRKLTNTEVVHHLDGNGENNSPANLMLFENTREHLETVHKHALKNPPKHRFGNKRWTEVERQIYEKETA
jgi:hypothetical protein